MTHPASHPRFLDADQGNHALLLVRLAVEAWVKGLEIGAPPPIRLPEEVRCPAFVTLTLTGRLRGCVGFLESDRPLNELLIECAVAAASRDTRFPPIGTDELPLLHYEISLLTPPQILEDPATVLVGLDGLLAEISGRRGLLLPQVAAQQGWDREAFLDQACLKAGGRAGDWRRQCRLWTFRAQVLSE
jgi:uncharacterized protein